MKRVASSGKILFLSLTIAASGAFAQTVSGSAVRDVIASYVYSIRCSYFILQNF